MSNKIAKKKNYKFVKVGNVINKGCISLVKFVFVIVSIVPFVKKITTNKK